MDGILKKFSQDNAFTTGASMAIIEAVADYNLKRYAQTDAPANILGAGGLYGFILYIFQNSLRKESLGRVNSVWDACSNILDVLVGISMGETYSLKQAFGFILISIGILLI